MLTQSCIHTLASHVYIHAHHVYTLAVMLTNAHACTVMLALTLSYTYTHNHVYTCLQSRLHMLTVMLTHAHTPGQGHLLPAVAIVSAVCRPMWGAQAPVHVCLL